MSFYNQNLNGLTPGQYDYLSKNYSTKGFVSDTSRIANYSNPMINTADRNWQELLRKDTGYTWSQSDQQSYKTNCNYGPHNSGSQLDAMIFKKK